MAEQLPLTVEALIDYLDKSFPNQCPDLQWSDKRVWYEAGRHSVVTHLRSLQQARDENILETHVSIRP